MQATAISAATWEAPEARSSAPQRVLIVNGNSDVLETLEPVLDAGNYDVVFVEAAAHAYSQIKRVQPDLVILCLDVEDADSLRVLSMLKLDADTRDIPVLTYTASQEQSPRDDDPAGEEPRLFDRTSPVLMN